MTAYEWQFSPRFRRGAFGWKSDAPIQRIKEAVAEIKQVSKKELSLAAEGAVLFLEKLSPAIEEADGSSGGIATAVNWAIEKLVPIVAKANANQAVWHRSLERLRDAVETDEIQCLEGIGNYWDELCAGPDVASRSADDFMATVTSVSNPFGSRQLTQFFALHRRPFRRPTRMMPFIQASQPQPVPALAPLLDAVDMHHEFFRCLLQRQALAQLQYCLRPHPGTVMLVQDAHLTQRLLLYLRQL